MPTVDSLWQQIVRLVVVALAAAIIPATVEAQPYPNRPIKIIVPYPAGGAVDIVARTIGQALAEQLKQPVIVDNRPGASANIGMEIVAKAPPNGYTLLMASNGLTDQHGAVPRPVLRRPRDFAPIARIGYAPLVIVVPPLRPQVAEGPDRHGEGQARRSHLWLRR